MNAEFSRLTTTRRQRRSQRLRWARVVSAVVAAIGLVALAWLGVLRFQAMPLPALVQAVTQA
jgi:flagellar biogenesis protein FliO